MKHLIYLLGTLLILTGLCLLIYPGVAYGWAEDNVANKSFFLTAIVGRLVFGIIFILAAKKSKFPKLFKVFGSLCMLGGLVFIFLGHEKFINLMISLIPEIKPYAIVSAIFAITIVLFSIFGYTGKTKVKSGK